MRDLAIVLGLVGYAIVLMAVSMVMPPCWPGDVRTTNGTSICVHRGK